MDLDSLVAIHLQTINNYTMKLLIALILAIPTYGLSLLIFFVYMIFKTSKVKPTMEKAITYLATDSSPLGTCFSEISYPQALGYASEVGTIQKKVNSYVEFTVDINGLDYLVTLNKEPTGNGAILTSRIAQ